MGALIRNVGPRIARVGYGAYSGAVRGGHRPLGSIAPSLQPIFGDQLLTQWPLWGPQLVTHDTVADSPDDFSADPPWAHCYVTTPDAHTVLDDATPAAHYIAQVLSNSVGPVQSFGFDVAPYGWDWCNIRLQGTANASVWFNVTAGTVGAQSGGTGAMAPLGGGLYRCTVTPTPGTVFTAGASLRLYTAATNGSVTHDGNPAKGLKVYNATVTQTSIVTAPNLYGDTMLALYGDRFDLTNDTKASQFVLVDDAWNGLPAAVASGVNYMTCPALAARYTGLRQPAFGLASVDVQGAGTWRQVFGMGNATSITPLHQMRVEDTNYMGHRRRDDTSLSKTDLPTTTTIAGRHSLGWMFTGTKSYQYVDAAAESTNQDLDVGTVSLDTLCLAALSSNGVISLQLTGVLREAAMGMLGANAQMLAASRYLMGRNPP